MNRTAQNGPVAGVGTRENGKGLDLNRDYMKLDSAGGALAGRLDEQVGSARAGRSAHHQRLVSRQPPDLFADPQSQRRCAADRLHARQDAGADPRRDAEDAQLAHLLLRQLRAGRRRRPRELARRSGQSRQHHLAHVRSPAALRQQLRRPAQSHRDPVGGLQLPGFQGPRRRDRGLRRGDLQVGRRQRQADHDADRAGRSRAHGAGDRQAGRAWRRHRDSRAAGEGRDPRRRCHEGAESAIRPRDAGDERRWRCRCR